MTGSTTRRDFLKTLGLGAAALAAPQFFISAMAQPTRRPNVLFILADDLGWADTHLYGSRYYQTPNIDALAGRGMMFTQAYAAAPLCSATRGSIMTGLWPARTGITGASCHTPPVKLQATLAKQGPPWQKALVSAEATRLKLEYRTLAEALKEAGYHTGHFGKWHLGSEPYDPTHQGFNVDVPHYPGPGPAGCYVAPWHFPPALNFTGEPGEHIEDRMASEAVKFIKESKAAGNPFYMSYWAFSVHAPFDAKKALIEEYTRHVDPNDPQHCPVYAAMVKSLDDAVGTLMKTLDEEGLAENTIVIFTSDNGGNMYDRVDGITPTSNAPLRGGKATLYEGGTREPLVVIWPGKIKPGTRNERDIVQSIDYYPTLLELTGAQAAPGQHFDGVSIVPALTGGALQRDTIFCHFPHDTPATGQRPGTYVRRGDWKLIRLYCDGDGQKDRFELYNLKDDIGETKDLAAQMPEKVRELNALIDEFLKASGAVVPQPNPRYNPAVPRPAVKREANTALPISQRKLPVGRKVVKRIRRPGA